MDQKIFQYFVFPTLSKIFDQFLDQTKRKPVQRREQKTKNEINV